MAMKLTTGILAVAMMAGGSAATKAAAQNPDAIDNARSVAKSLQQKQANDSNAALEAAGVPAQPTKPTAGAPAPAVKPATIPGAKPASAASVAAVKPAPAPKAAAPAKAAVKPASAAASSQNNRLERVNVIRKADDFQIEISSREAVTPRVSKLSSPARVVVELPATVMATPQSKIAVGSAGVKGVRIGMDGKTPPTTSVVVDLDQACGYELTPGPGNTVVLTLHTQAVAKSAAAPVPVKASASPAKVQAAVAKPVAVPVSAAPKVVAVAAPKVASATAPSAKVPLAKVEAPKAAEAKAPVAKGATTKIAAPVTKPATAKADKPGAAAASKPAAAANAKGDAAKQPKPEEKKWAMNGKRDPFFSPVVQQTGGSGCSTGKKCLEIGQINLRGVVKSENGFIAVVTNNLNKAYFLRENDPVFNGYVVRITGDSVVFQETVQDKLGKPFTREVVKRIFTPAV
jgi:hypothetical protein